MTPDLRNQALQPPDAEGDGAQRWIVALLLVLGSTVLAGLLGFGLATSLQPLLPVSAGLIGAATGAAVAGLVVPLALWGRWPSLPRLPSLPVRPQPAGTAPSRQAGAAVDPQRPARDALTGAYTQQHFIAAADREWARIRRHGEDAALLMVDVDRFKALNEQHGGDCCDALLVEITRQVSTTLRQYDLLARFAGGVLVAYLPHTDPIGALDAAERIRERVAGVRLGWNGQTVKATVSVGATGIGAAHATLDEVITDAGAALREAKSSGRNCVRAAPIPPRRNVANGNAPGARRRAGPV